TQSIALYFTLINRLQSNLVTVDLLRSVVSQSIKGYAAQKKASRIALETMTVNIMNAAYAWAVEENDDVLKDAMLVSTSKLSKMTYGGLIQFVQGVINTISPLVTAGDLDDVNVT